MDRNPPTLDMRPDGTFRTEPTAGPRAAGATAGPAFRVPVSTKLMIGGVIVAMVGASLAVALLAIWAVSMILPVVIIAGGVAWAAMRVRRWQSGRGQGPANPLQPGRFR